MTRYLSLTTALICCILAAVVACNRSSSSTSYASSDYEHESTTYGTDRSETTYTEKRSTRSRREASDANTRSMAFPTGEEGSSVLLVTKQMPRQVRAGSTFEYCLTVKNISDQPLEGVMVFDRVPSDVTVAVSKKTVTTERFAVREYRQGDARDPFLPRYTSDPTAAEIKGEQAFAIVREDRKIEESKLESRQETTYGIERADAHAGHEQPNQAYLAGEWYIGHLAPGESRTIALTGTAPQTGVLATCTTVAYQPTICLITEVVKPELKLVRLAPEQVDACEEAIITYRVTNTGTGRATGIVIEEQLPEGQTLATNNQRAVRFELDALDEGKTEEFTTRTKFAKRGAYRGAASVTDGDGAKVESEPSEIKAVAPELAIDVSAPEQGYTARPVQYTIKVTNTGDGPANDLRVRLALPEGCRCFESSNNGQVAGDSLTWENLRALKPGESIELTAGIDTQTEGDLRTTVTADADCATSVSDTAQTALRAVGSLLLEVVDTNDPVPLQSNEVYKIRVTNQGDKADKNVRIVVTIPDEMEFADSRASVQPQRDGRTVTYTLTTLEPGTTETIQLSAKAIQAGDVRFKVEMTSQELTQPVMETEATKLY